VTSARDLPRLDSVRRLVERAGIAPREAEDVGQDALQRIWEKLDRIDPAGNGAAWMRTVAVNLARDHLRTPRVRAEVLTPFDEGDEIEDDRLDPEARAILRARLAVLQLLIDQIDARRRDVFVEHELLGKSLAEIAAHHRIPEATAAKRLRKAWEEVDAARVRWQAAQRRRSPGCDGMGASGTGVEQTRAGEFNATAQGRRKGAKRQRRGMGGFGSSDLCLLALLLFCVFASALRLCVKLLLQQGAGRPA